MGLLGHAGTARADPSRPPAFAAAADTDSVAAGRDTLPQDSTARDSAALDSLPADSAGRDTTEVTTDFPPRDELYDRLADMGGFRVVEYRGRDVELDVDEEAVRLRGEAQARYASSVLDADTIAYWAGLRYISARRNIKLEGEGRTVTSDSVINYDVSRTTGTIMDARTAFAERGAEWFVRGDATPRGARKVFVETGSFTSCDLEEPHYYFRAGQIKVVSEDVLVAWPITLYIQNVPIVWLPFFAQDIRQGRRSGILPPRFGVNDIVSTSDDVGRSVTDFGFYWAVSEFMDAQWTVDWFSGRFTRLNGAFRYKSLKKFFQGNLLASNSFGDERTLQLQADHQHQITPVTNLRLDANYISNTRVFEEQSLDPRQQTQRISSDLGLQHRFPFASVNLSASRRQDLGTLRGSTELTLPNAQVTFTPITLFRAPRTRSGPFNNIVVSGGTSFSRREQQREADDDLRTTRAAANTGIRIGAFGVSGNSSFDRQVATPFDSLGGVPPSQTRTRIDYSGSADYQVDLVGSTTLRPTVTLSASQFRSDSTGGRFLSAPARLGLGATLSSDVYGFFPGFGPFSRIRHKVSPRFSYSYSPPVEAADSLLQIPGFPISSSREENRLSITLNQTFEAKIRDDIQLTEEELALLEGRSLEEDSLAADSVAVAPGQPEEDPEADLPIPEAAPDSLPLPPDSTVFAADSAALADTAAAADTTLAARTRADSLGATGRSAPPRQPRNIVLLGINSSGLDFDFARRNEPKLTTDRWSHRINSDLLRGLSVNLSLDLFEGTGEERQFAPILSDLTGSFTFSSARGLAGLFGIGGGASRQSEAEQRLRTGVDSRYRLQSFEENPDPRDPGLRSGGPWNLSVTYSLQRGRESESREDRQSLSGILSLNPTSNWRLSWRTSYNLSDGEFGEHLVTLDRDLHRWVATFMFARAPNGNFIFQMSVNLRDAPDLKFDYDQQSLDR